MGKDFMYNVGNYEYEKLSESGLAEMQSWNEEFDPDTLLTKNKAAYAFSLWVRAVQTLSTFQHQRVPAVKAA